MLSDHENLKLPIDQWPSDWNELSAFLNISDDTETRKQCWKKLVTTYLRSESLIEESDNTYEKYFKNFWLETRPRIFSNDNGLIAAAMEGNDVYIRNWLQNLSQDERNILFNEKTNSDDTALHIVVKQRFGSTVDVLIEMGAEVNVTGNLQETPLHLAAYKNDVDMLRRLLKAGADCQIRRYDSEMPIHVAVMAGSADVVDELIKHDPKQLTVAGREGRTAFIRAAIDNKTNVMTILLQHGDDINQINPNSGHTALHIAAQKNKPDMVKFLVERGADVNILSSNEMTALSFCVKQDRPSVEAARALLENGANLNAGDPTPLQLLARYNLEESPQYLELKELFITYGAIPEADGSEATLTKRS